MEKGTLSGPTRGYNPTTPKCKRNLHYVDQTQQQVMTILKYLSHLEIVSLVLPK